MRQLPADIRPFFSFGRWKAKLVFWGGAIVVGVVSAVFALGAEAASAQFERIVAHGAYWPLLLTPAGLALIALVTQRYFPGAQGSGIPQAIAALQLPAEQHGLRSAVLSIRIAIGKVLLTILGLLCGASIGREGPTVHIGASIMYAVGNWARFPRHYLDQSLIVAGGAAGIAAAFNTPLAGIVFAIEEMARSFEERTSGTMLTAVLLAGVTAIAFLGNYTYFGSTGATLELGRDWMIIPIIGVVGGLLGGAFARILIDGSRRLAPVLARRPILVPALCGLIVAIIGIISGSHTYGTGYHEAKAALTGSEDIGMAFPFLKMLATIASYMSGIPGGIFAPSLATGAGLGTVMAAVFSPDVVQAVVLLTMVSYFAGVVQSPITGFVIVMEMTDNHNMVLPLMAGAFIGMWASSLICREPLYRALAAGFLDKMKPKATGAAEEKRAPD